MCVYAKSFQSCSTFCDPFTYPQQHWLVLATPVDQVFQADFKCKGFLGIKQFLKICDPMDYMPAMLLLSMGFSSHEDWRGLPYPPPRDLPNPGIKPTSPAAPALAGRFIYHQHQLFEAPKLIHIYTHIYTHKYMQLNVRNLLLFHEPLLYLPRTVVVQLLSHV